MEDRYLFKAKRKDNGEWVQGALLLHDTDAATIFNQHPADGSLQGFEVDPSTICQCTGLKDKNSELIWENDIVSFAHENYTRNYAIEFKNTFHNYGLRFRNKSIHFRCTQVTLCMHDCEVIGNIFDNPELLESEGQYDRK